MSVIKLCSLCFNIKGFSKRDIAEYLGINERWLYRLWDRAEKEVNAYEQ